MTSKVEMVSVVIPTLNEAGNIREALDTLDRELIFPNEIIVVDGNSTDGTIEIVKDSKARLIIEPRRGYGLALRVGMKAAKGNVVVMVDGDGTYEFKHINRLVQGMVDNDAEMCLATRMYDPNKAMGLFNFVGNKLITFCFNMLYKQNFSDTQSGFRAISHSALEKVNFKETDMPFATEMLIKFSKKRFKIVEVHSTYKFRRYGKTKLKPFNSGIEILATILKGLRS
ncbi:MAG: glycosyltransferase family 2 protein [Candidatus Bathyarchaeota archaeon]|nr:glycosyltransferase family 2 protein [Candidatus Bathyarchaeota archaeon]